MSVSEAVVGGRSWDGAVVRVRGASGAIMVIITGIIVGPAPLITLPIMVPLLAVLLLMVLPITALLLIVLPIMAVITEVPVVPVADRGDVPTAAAAGWVEVPCDILVAGEGSAGPAVGVGWASVGGGRLDWGRAAGTAVLAPSIDHSVRRPWWQFF